MQKVPNKPTKPALGFSEKEIRAKHDTMYKIKEGAKQLTKGRYLNDQQMRELCKIATNVWRGHSEHQDFDRFKMKLGGVTYWGVPEYISKMKGDLNA